MKSKCFFAVMLILLMLLPLIPAGAASAFAAVEPVRVGYFSFSGYHNQDETGRRSGYGYEFLQLLARFTDWTYDYQAFDKSYDDCLEMLKNGQLDIVTSVSKNAEREKNFLFSDKEIGTNSTILTVKAGNSEIKKGEYDTYNEKRIGMLTGNSKNNIFESFAEEHGFKIFHVYRDKESELLELLENGKVDGIVTGSLRNIGDNEWVIESIDPQPFYACTRKDDNGQRLMNDINAALDELDVAEPDWRNTLRDKYYSTDTGGNVVLSSEEREYLESLKNDQKELTVLVNPDRAPYSYFEQDKAMGIFAALFEKMTENVDIPYRYVVTRDRAEYYEKRNSGEIDIVLDLNDDMDLAEKIGYKITDVYYTTTHTMIKRRDFNGTPTVFAVQTYADNPYSDYLADHIGDGTETKRYQSLDESVEAVRRGECDATVTLSYVAELYLWADDRGQLTSELIGETASSYTLGVNNATQGHILLSILNKCVAALSRSAVNTVVTEQVSKLRPSANVGLISFLRRNPIYIVVIVTVTLLLLFTVAMLAVRTYNQRKLEQKVEEATSKLQAQTNELSAALHAADAANRSKTTFLNNMSHDIRTPMNAIIGFTALATAHIDNKERALDYLAKISQSSNHLLSLINDVLDMSRIESGKVHIDERPENLADILQGLRNIIQSDIHSKHLELFIDTVDVTEEEVYCDKLRLNQILLNLASNAIKFTQSGGSVFIKVTQKPSEKEDCGIYEFSVKDTGIGMSPEFAETVFDPFTRERNSTVSGIQGTGLGMAITKNIVDIMGGNISVQSEQGKGTEFVVKLELKFADSAPEEIPLAELNGLYALVVDDDLISCQSVSKMLRRIGMHAEWTVTGKEAIVRTTEAIELEHPFEVYIIDWAMPDMDGITTVRNIRAIIGDDSPIILMSAYDWADIEQEARAAGVTGFVSKPLFASDLHRALEKSLGKDEPVEQPIKKENKFAGKRILLVEDNELNREIAEDILTEAGFSVESAVNGKIAYDMVADSEEGYYDLVLMDVQMPIMDGYEASRKIRALENEALANVPIIAMTANAFEEDKANAFAAGMNGHLAKPINIDNMFALLEQILSDETN